MARLPPSYFMCMLFSCILSRIFGVKQLVAFFAANVENINFVMHRHYSAYKLDLCNLKLQYRFRISTIGIENWFHLLAYFKKNWWGSLFLCNLNMHKILPLYSQCLFQSILCFGGFALSVGFSSLAFLKSNCILVEINKKLVLNSNHTLKNPARQMSVSFGVYVL